MSLARKLIEVCDSISKCGHPCNKVNEGSPLGEQCPYAEGGSYSLGDYDTPSYSESPNCSIAGFECPFDLDEEFKCPIYQLKEGNSDELAEIFCYDSEIRDGKLFCMVNNQPCQKVNDIKNLVFESRGNPSGMYENDCPLQIHDENNNVRDGKSE